MIGDVCLEGCCRQCTINGLQSQPNWTIFDRIRDTKLCYFVEVQFLNAASSCPTATYVQGGKWLLQCRSTTTDELVFNRIDASDGRNVSVTIKRGPSNNSFVSAFSVEYGEQFLRIKRDSGTTIKWDVETNCLDQDAATCGVLFVTLVRSYFMRKAADLVGKSVSVSLSYTRPPAPPLAGYTNGCSQSHSVTTIYPYIDGYCHRFEAFTGSVNSAIIRGTQDTDAITFNCQFTGNNVPGMQWPIGRFEALPDGWFPPCDFDPLSPTISISCDNTGFNDGDLLTGNISF